MHHQAVLIWAIVTPGNTPLVRLFNTARGHFFKLLWFYTPIYAGHNTFSSACHKPTTTTSSMKQLAEAKTTSIVHTLIYQQSLEVLILRKRISVLAFAGTFKVYAPSRFVVVPVVVPFTTTLNTRDRLPVIGRSNNPFTCIPCPKPDNEHTMTRRIKIVFFHKF